MQQLGVNQILDRQADVSRTQLQLSSGRRLLSSADDPVAAARIADLEQSLQQLEQYRQNADLAQNRLGLTESVLADAGNILQRARELALQGNNDTNTRVERSFIAQEVRQLLDEMLDLANSRDGNGEYLFAGYRSTTQPFQTDGLGGFSYSGDEGSRMIQISADRQLVVGEPGADVFMKIRTGNGTFATAAASANTGAGIIDPGSVVDAGAYVPGNYSVVFTTATTYDIIDVDNAVTLVSGATYGSGSQIGFNGLQFTVSGAPVAGDTFTIQASSGQDVFRSLQNLADALEQQTTTAAERAAFHNRINRFLADVDQAQNHLIEARSRSGARQRTVEQQQGLNESYQLQFTEAVSQLRDVDFADAASRLSLQLTVLEAAQQAFVRVQGLSLFNFLR
jgi:flagellar hook-associated protein 3 FlgL